MVVVGVDAVVVGVDTVVVGVDNVVVGVDNVVLAIARPALEFLRIKYETIKRIAFFYLLDIPTGLVICRGSSGMVNQGLPWQIDKG